MSEPTDEQKVDLRRFKNYLRREGLSGVLNDTKWRELFDLMIEYNKLFPVSFLRKDVREVESNPSRWSSDLYHIFGGWNAIEWLKIKSESVAHKGALLDPIVVSHAIELMAALRASGIPFAIVDDAVTVYGYLRRGVNPEWARQ